MGFFQVTSTELMNKAEQLRDLNTNFKQEVNKLESKEAELQGKWVGEANKTFHRSFTNDKGQMDKFSNLIDRYIVTLQEIAKQYSKTEASNAEIARSRNY